MDLNIKKDLAANWFKMLQDSICYRINKLEKNNKKFISTTWKRNLKKDVLTPPIDKFFKNLSTKETNIEDKNDNTRVK